VILILRRFKGCCH